MPAPTITLRAMTPAEYDLRAAQLDEEYAESLTVGMSTEQAKEKARQDRAGFLPEGTATEGHRLLVAENEAGEVVGYAWFGPDPQTGAIESAWLYDIAVTPEHRGSGHGRAILTAVEALARQAGATRLRLNVFGANRTAVTLYETSGYRVDQQQMSKPLD